MKSFNQTNWRIKTMKYGKSKVKNPNYFLTDKVDSNIWKICDILLKRCYYFGARTH